MVKKICCYFNFSFVKIIEIIAGKLIENKSVDKALTLCTISKVWVNNSNASFEESSSNNQGICYFSVIPER